MAQRDPPNFVLVSKPPSNQAANVSSSTLVHPAVIHYQYADDQPLHLMPHPNQTILVMDYDDRTPNVPPVVQSLSEDVAVIGVKVTQAPGAVAAATGQDGASTNPNMYVIETTGKSPPQRAVSSEPPVVDAIFVSQFKQRNAHLRQVASYGTPSRETHLASSVEPPTPISQVPEFPTFR